MPGFYKPHRNENWNYDGGRWRLSRSKIDLFKNCPKCFYIDNKLGTARPPGYPFNLNSAVDHLLKKEFDIHRKEQTPHPLMEEYGIEAVPFKHEDIDEWRDNFKGVVTKHKDSGLTVSGAIDDVWVNPDTNELYVVDYKATSKDKEVDLDADWQDGYKRQMEVYQWLLRQNGFNVSNIGYFVYANGKRDAKSFDNKLEFNTKIISYEGNDSWVEDSLVDIKKTLEGSVVPESSEDCEYCAYREATEEVVKKHEKEHWVKKEGDEEKETKKKSKKSQGGETLF